MYYGYLDIVSHHFEMASFQAAVFKPYRDVFVAPTSFHQICLILRLFGSSTQAIHFTISRSNK